MVRIITRLFLLILHIVPLGLLYYFWLPIAKWYLEKKPALGLDLFLSSAFVSHYLKDLRLPLSSFQDFWFGGYTMFNDYPQLIFYLMLPLAAHFGAPAGVQVFTTLSLFAIALFSYLLFYQISKNYGLSFFLAMLILLSPNIYGSAIWAGSIPYFASQALFPLSLFFGAKYLEKPSIRCIAALALVVGIGFYVHPLSMSAFVIPTLFTIILIGGWGNSLNFLTAVRHIVFFLGGLVLVTFAFTSDRIWSAITTFASPIAFSKPLTSGAVQAAAGNAPIADFYKSQIERVFTDTNWFLLVFAGISIVLFFIAALSSRQKKQILVPVSFFLVAGYTLLHPVLNLSGTFYFFQHDIYRAFWPFPIALAGFIASSWGFFEHVLDNLLKKLGNKLFYPFKAVSFTFTSILFFGLSYVIFTTNIDGLLVRLDYLSEYTSAYPEAIGIDLSKENLGKLKGKLLPSFINPVDKNKRLYAADATVNIWWNSLFDMPLVRGYVDPPIGTQSRGGFFWTDIALTNDSLTRDFGSTPELALANSLFLIDWYAVGYIEGGRLGSKGPSPGPSSYLLENNIFDKEEFATTSGAILKYQTASGKPELVMDIPQNLHYYKVGDQFTSPIIVPTNASAVIIFSSDPDYEDILRILASENLNSKKIIPVKGVNIDDLNLKDLSAFDAIFLTSYTYRDPKKAFALLEKYVERGGKIFIDTGAETKESNGNNLSAIFPFDASERKGLGEEWAPEVQDSIYFDDVEVDDFGPLVFNGSEWKVTVPKDLRVRSGVNILLRQQGNPVLIERNLGSGRVIWSGLNLPYHINQHKSQSEIRLFLNILNNFVSVQENPILEGEAKWLTSEDVIVSTPNKPRGILLKEQGYSGWHASVTSPQKMELPIYKTGPTFPGFMYVSTKDLPDGPITVKFTYTGKLEYWITTAISIIAIMFLMEVAVLGGKVTGKIVKPALRRVEKRVGSWWDKEEV